MMILGLTNGRALLVGQTRRGYIQEQHASAKEAIRAAKRRGYNEIAQDGLGFLHLSQQKGK